GVALDGHLAAVYLAAPVRQFGDAAHPLGSAATSEEIAALVLARSVLIGEERRLPDLHGMDPRGLIALCREDHHAPVFQPRIAVAEHGILQLAADQVVGEQR